MKIAETFREKIGLSQQELADYIRVSREQLALYETGRRSLPTKAMTKLAAIVIFLDSAPPDSATERPHQAAHLEKAKQLLQSHANEHRYRLTCAQRKLEAVQKNYSRQMRLLDVLDHLRATAKEGKDKEFDQLWLDLMHLYAIDAINRNSLDKQIMLQLEISGLQQQYEQAMQLLEQQV